MQCMLFGSAYKEDHCSMKKDLWDPATTLKLVGLESDNLPLQQKQTIICYNKQSDNRKYLLSKRHYQ